MNGVKEIECGRLVNGGHLPWSCIYQPIDPFPYHCAILVFCLIFEWVARYAPRFIVPECSSFASIEGTHIEAAMVPVWCVYLAGGALGMPWVCDGTKSIVTRSL